MWINKEYKPERVRINEPIYLSKDFKQQLRKKLIIKLNNEKIKWTLTNSVDWANNVTHLKSKVS